MISWPLDQVLYQDEFSLLDFEILPDFGSDQYPVAVRVCHAPEAARLQPAPELQLGDTEEAKTSVEAARALSPEGVGTGTK